MATRRTGGSTSKGKVGTMQQQVRRTGGQARMRRELANQRRAMGAAGVARAMSNWGLSGKASTPKTAAKRTATRGGRGGGGGKVG